MKVDNRLLHITRTGLDPRSAVGGISPLSASPGLSRNPRWRCESRQPAAPRHPTQARTGERWEIPIEIDGRRDSIRGELAWVPPPPAGWWYAVAGLVVLAAAAVLFSR